MPKTIYVVTKNIKKELESQKKLLNDLKASDTIQNASIAALTTSNAALTISNAALTTSVAALTTSVAALVTSTSKYHEDIMSTLMNFQNNFDQRVENSV